MKSSQTTNQNKHSFGWIAVCAGILIFISGIVMRIFQPGFLADSRFLEGFGILLAGWGIIPLVHSISAWRNPAAARRNQLTENDERALENRNQEAYTAFLFSMAATSIVLLGYSSLTRGQIGFDPIWMALAFLVIAPAIVFVVIMSWQDRY